MICSLSEVINANMLFLAARYTKDIQALLKKMHTCCKFVLRMFLASVSKIIGKFSAF